MGLETAGTILIHIRRGMVTSYQSDLPSVLYGGQSVYCFELTG